MARRSSVELRRAERRRQIKAVALIAPLFLFVVVTFVVPIVVMLFNAVHDDPTSRHLMPKTVAALANWDGKDLPDEAAFAALAEDLKQAQKDKNVADPRQAHELRAFRHPLQGITTSGRKLDKVEPGHRRTP